MSIVHENIKRRQLRVRVQVALPRQSVKVASIYSPTSFRANLKTKISSFVNQLCCIFSIMTRSVPNLTGSSDVAKTPYGDPRSFPKESFAEYGGEKAVIYRSPDGKIAAGFATESGSCSITYPCDEFFFVTNGWCDAKISGGDSFRLNKGECIYIKKGTAMEFVFGSGFENLAVFLDNQKVTLF